VFTIGRIERSRSTGLGVHDQTESMFTIHRNAQGGPAIVTTMERPPSPICDVAPRWARLPAPGSPQPAEGSRRAAIGRMAPAPAGPSRGGLCAVGAMCRDDGVNDQVSIAIARENEAERLRREAGLLAEARAEFDAGLYVDADEVDAWIDSIGTDHELPPPPTRHR
jgi:hypothetical protein